VLFFVLNENRDPIRTSAEGGDYLFEQDNLTFYHLYNYSGMIKMPPSMLKVFNQGVVQDQIS